MCELFTNRFFLLARHVMTWDFSDSLCSLETCVKLLCLERYPAGILVLNSYDPVVVKFTIQQL